MRAVRASLGGASLGARVRVDARLGVGVNGRVGRGGGAVGTVMLVLKGAVLNDRLPSASRPAPVNGVLPSLASTFMELMVI